MGRAALASRLPAAANDSKSRTSLCMRSMPRACKVVRMSRCNPTVRRSLIPPAGRCGLPVLSAGYASSGARAEKNCGRCMPWAQFLSAAFGSALLQGFATQCPVAYPHADTDLYVQLKHDVKHLHGSAQTALCPTSTQPRVTSFHHLAVAELSNSMVFEAISTLGRRCLSPQATGATGVSPRPAPLADSAPVVPGFLDAARRAARERLAAGHESDP